MKKDEQQFNPNKILRHLDRVNAWLNGENPPPITVELDMTNVCNYHCSECTGWYYFQNRNSYSLSPDLAKDIIKQLVKVKARGLVFTGGGEPLCHPYIKEAVRLAYNLGLDVGFITNGSLIDEEIAKVLLECCTWLRISLDAASVGTFERIHGINGNEFNNVVNNIMLLAKMKNRFRSKTTIGIGYLTCDYTINEMYDATILCKELGADYLQFRPLLIHNNGKFKYYCANIMNKLSRCLRESRGGFEVLYSKDKYEKISKNTYQRYYKKCYGHQFVTVISANAKVYLCCNMRGHNKYCLGDLQKDSFETIWNSQHRKQVVENINFQKCIPFCRNHLLNQILWDIEQPRKHPNFL